jgi:hypothetical protein
MPRFVARPVVVEACQFVSQSTQLPYDFRVAVKRMLANGTADVMTGDGMRVCKPGDWIMRGPDGTFSVVRDAVFEAMFQEHVPPVVVAPVRSRRSEVLA